MVNPSADGVGKSAHFIRRQVPTAGLFAGFDWRIGPGPFLLDGAIAEEIEGLGRVLHQFNRAVNLLYRQSVTGKQPAWVAAWLDQGKPDALIEWQRSAALKNEVPRVIRPDLLLTESGLCLVELDSVPGGIGLTAWLNHTYAQLPVPSEPEAALAGCSEPVLERHRGESQSVRPGWRIMGGAEGMHRGFAGIFGEAPKVHIVISTEASTYRPEMEWLARQLDESRFAVRDTHFTDFQPGDAVYRFFELFDLPNVANATAIFAGAEEKRWTLTPPPKPIFEEKMLFALLWNRNLQPFWRAELGEGFFERMQRLVPYSWLVDPAPLPPHAAIPTLNLTDWRQLQSLSQRDRQLVLKVSGFSEKAWGARGVFLGSDLSQADWAAAVNTALADFPCSPYILQRYHKPKLVSAQWYDFASDQLIAMPGRVRLCPYYFVTGQAEAARANLGGVLATICPADKKIIHGMSEAILAPCAR
jgi:hypothetical protein